MADDNSYQANQDVIAGARAIRSNPAALAQLVALLNPPPSASPRADPAGALATSRSSVPNMSDAMAGSAMMPGGGPLGASPSMSSVRALINALASAPMPPVRPANFGATAVLPPPIRGVALRAARRDQVIEKITSGRNDGSALPSALAGRRDKIVEKVWFGGLLISWGEHSVSPVAAADPISGRRLPSRSGSGSSRRAGRICHCAGRNSDRRPGRVELAI